MNWNQDLAQKIWIEQFKKKLKQFGSNLLKLKNIVFLSPPKQITSDESSNLSNNKM